MLLIRFKWMRAAGKINGGGRKRQKEGGREGERDTDRGTERERLPHGP